MSRALRLEMIRHDAAVFVDFVAGWDSTLLT